MSLPAALLRAGRDGALQALQALHYNPPPRGPVPIHPLRPPAPLRPGQDFTLLCWNLQFAGSRRHHFFYDGGEVVRLPRASVVETALSIRDVLRQVSPDVALLQEVDRGADRTARVDQLQIYLEHPWSCWLSAPYHRSLYVPYPPHRHLGRVEMHLAILSRLELQGGERLALPLLQEPWLRQVFNLKRAILAARIPVSGAAPIRLADTHLSAFSRGDGTMARQVEVLLRWMEEDPRFILGGDFNLLPPGDDPARLSVEAALYADRENPIEALIPRFCEAFGPDLRRPEGRTYLPYGASQPDRKIDYLLLGAPMEVVEARVLSEFSGLSDHLPLWARLKAPEV